MYHSILRKTLNSPLENKHRIKVHRFYFFRNPDVVRMAYITVSAGWCANHLAARLFDELEGEFLDEQERPRLALIDRKGAAKLHTFDSQPVESEEKGWFSTSKIFCSKP